MPFSTSDWVSAWHETIGKEWELLLLSINDDVIAPFARQGNEIILAGGQEVADYLDIIGPDEKKVAAWQEIKIYLKGNTLHLHNVPENSPTVKCFEMQKEDTTPVTELPQVLSKKNQHEMERKIRKFERENKNITFVENNDIDILLSLMKLDPRKKEFLAPDMEAFFRKIHTMGTITKLLVENKPVAALLAFRVGDVIMSYNSGYSESTAGFYLKAMHIKRAADAGIKIYNFLQGNERYKYELGGRDFFVYKTDVLL